jgi:hypothetical protein
MLEPLLFGRFNLHAPACPLCAATLFKLPSASTGTGVIPPDRCFRSIGFGWIQQSLDITDVFRCTRFNSGDHLPAICIANEQDFLGPFLGGDSNYGRMFLCPEFRHALGSPSFLPTFGRTAYHSHKNTTSPLGKTVSDHNGTYLSRNVWWVSVFA